MALFLVTGGAGFIGSHLCERLLGAGHRVRVLDDLSTGHRRNVPDGAEFCLGSVTDPDAVRAAFAGVDGCFHLAAIASVQRSNEDWLGTHDVNLTGAIRIFDAAARMEQGPVPVVYASSAAAYGDSPDLPLSEASPVRPLTAYGADKLGCEQHGRVGWLVHGVPSTGFRFFNVYGPRQDPKSPYSGVISIFTSRLLGGQTLTIFGDGSQNRDFVYVGDVVSHMVAAMEQAVPDARVFNVCTGRSTTVLELAQVLGDIVSVTPEICFAAPRPGDIHSSLGNPEKAAAALGVRAQTSLRDGLAETIAFQRRFPD